MVIFDLGKLVCSNRLVASNYAPVCLEKVLRNQRWLQVVVALLLSFLLVVLLWSTPIQPTIIGEALASWAASLFEGSGQNKDQILFQLEIWMNFLIFIPFSISLFFAAKRYRLSIALTGSLVLSIGAELAQKYIIVQRVATVQDVLLNFSGAITGVLIGVLFTRLGKRIRTSR
jgi:glycopeptide antibiotics resistance protein